MEALVEYNYDAQEPDELSIRKGDIIRDVKVLNGGWWEGTLRDKRGMFPDNFVKVIEGTRGSRNSSEQEEVTLRNGSGRRLCKVLFSYEPCNEDELKLVPEEAIEYLGEVEEGWWRGKIKGRIGVFPSNFVTPPVPEEADRGKDKKELCRALFPYEAANEDELTLVEGDIITLISRDAPDKGWWKGELKGQVGLFPDNFVEVLQMKNDTYPDGPVSQVSTTKSLTKTLGMKKKETAVVRKSLDSRNLRPEVTAKKITSPSSNTPVSGSLEKKSTNNLISSLKRLVGESSGNGSTSNGNGNITGALGEELDEVERGEGAPLSHLTASRAKAPRRRLPSTQHLRHQNTLPSESEENPPLLPEESTTNGNSETVAPPNRDDENDGMVAKTRKKAPWVEELKLNQMERRKVGTEINEKSETKKERVFSWLSSSSSVDTTVKTDVDGEEVKSKDKEKEKPVRPDPPSLSKQPLSPPIPSPPAYVPYHLYSQLLDRIAALEEKQTVLQRKVNQLSDQLAPFVANAGKDKD
ncbi:hypothetical protein QAD02_005998 [Eretmocerus hayati]|uniref:Uncharacterized protein n=1 Tax=Eretmocerus hayati TaxID=131215 RepID=A0ACC2N0G6_9HYME|nr:hypothetical protein QAD02_005998 [Eretmocerus hayati]